ncbi:hypothetical protein [uncultured Desulfovibrio sp.]|uniref:hypothetical protein n=1 Tax=uncultured Desulfovibrio sp. TaxID=167968 RepID=UPI00262A2CBB|nr:hypothetical protein [uncultured Desulfovibrio sp.]
MDGAFGIEAMRGARGGAGRAGAGDVAAGDGRASAATGITTDFATSPATGITTGPATDSATGITTGPATDFMTDPATDGLRVRPLDGPADSFAAVWERLCRWGCGRLLLWDVEPERRKRCFLELPERAGFFEATRHGEPVAYAWLGPLAAGCPVAQIHFGGASHADTLAAGRLLLEALRREGRWRSLVGVIPWPYRHARRLARGLGFAEQRVPGLCRLAGRLDGRERIVPGAFVVKELA